MSAFIIAAACRSANGYVDNKVYDFGTGPKTAVARTPEDRKRLCSMT